MNKVILIGRVSSKPTFLTTKSNIPFIRFSLAVSRRRYSQDVEPITDFIPIVAWRQNATILDRSITVGSLIAIEGTLQGNRVMNNTNAYLTNYEVHIENFQLLETKDQLEMRRQKLAQRSTEPTFEAGFNDFEISEQKTFAKNQVNEKNQITESQDDISNFNDSDDNPFADWDIDDLSPK